MDEQKFSIGESIKLGFGFAVGVLLCSMLLASLGVFGFIIFMASQAK